MAWRPSCEQGGRSSVLVAPNRVAGRRAAVVLVLRRRRDEGPLGATDSTGEDRLWGISYRTPNAEAARERLLRRGFAVSEVRSGRKPGTRVCTVHGEPCGVATLLIARDDLSRSRDG